MVSVGKFDEARSTIDKSLTRLKDFKNQALLSNKAAEVLMIQGKQNEAEAILKKIDTHQDLFLEAVTHTNQGFLYLTRARNDLALESLQQALSQYQESGNQNSREAAKCLADLSLVYLSTGKLNQAEENGVIALQIRQRLFPENSEEVAASYNDLGVVYSQNNPDKALDYYEKALAVYEKINGPDHPKIAQAKSNIGILYRKLKLYGDAITNFETAETILKKNFPGGHPSQAFAEVNLGLTYQEMKDNKTALIYLEKALALYQQFYGNKHSDISSVYNRIGLIKLADKHYDDALHDFQAALCANVPSFNSLDIMATPPARGYYNGKVLLYSLRLKAQALEASYYGKTLKFENLRLALTSLYTCDTLIDHIRHNSPDENDKIELGEAANETYEDGVRIAVAMSEVSVEPSRYRMAAFYFAEKSKSAVLQESIADAEAKSFAGIPQDLVEQEKNFKAAMVLLVQKLSQKPAPEEEKYLRETQFNLNGEYSAFIKKLESDYPDYYNLKFNASSPDIPQLQKLLDAKTGIVSYFIAEKGKKLYQFLITPKNFKIKSFSLDENFDKNLKGYMNSLLYSDIGSYKKSTSVLSRILVPRFQATITELVMIPAGRLGTLPFEALPYKRLSGKDFKTVHFLAERFAVSYEFSAGLLVQKGKAGNISAQPSIFLCAPVTFDSETSLPSLPGTEQEVASIAKLFPPASASVVTLSDATEDVTKSGKLANYDYLHFATHGTVDEINPELSRIFLHPGANDDGNLFSGEIYTLNLHAKLAVLSACQTGLGKVSKGEGVIGLTRALKYAGAKNIIVSFWSVADASTSMLMTDFYTTMLQNKDNDFRKSLQVAKLKMIHEGVYSDPYYWAPFVLIGF
jgi:tetratricopeptide (TPR) repeat protein